MARRRRVALAMERAGTRGTMESRSTIVFCLQKNGSPYEKLPSILKFKKTQGFRGRFKIQFLSC